MWLAAAEYAQRLRGACGLEPHQVEARVRQLAQARERAAVTPEPKARPALRLTPRSAPKQAATAAPEEPHHPPPPRLILRRPSLKPAASQPDVAANGSAKLQSPLQGGRLRRVGQRQGDAAEDVGGEGVAGAADVDAALADDEWPKQGRPQTCLML